MTEQQQQQQKQKDQSVTAAAVEVSSLYQAGDTVYTYYGAGVIVAVDNDCSDNDNPCSNNNNNNNNNSNTNTYTTTSNCYWYTVRLWRIPYRSIGSTAIAKLRPNMIMKRIPVAPGMVTYLLPQESITSDVNSTITTATGEVAIIVQDDTNNDKNSTNTATKQSVMVHSYYASTDTYLISTVSTTNTITTTQDDNSNSTIQYRIVSSNELYPTAPSSKFYPIIEVIMKRADQTAITVDTILRSTTSQQIVQTTSQLLQKGVDTIQSSTTTAISTNNEIINQDTITTTVNTTLQGLEQKAKEVVPEMEENIQLVLNMMKNDDIVTLLQKCQVRLQQLSTTNLISDVTQQTLQRTGIYINMSGTDENCEMNEMKNNNNNIIQTTIDASRTSALDAVQNLLQYTKQLEQSDDIISIKNDLAKQFTIVFDSISKVSQSDPIIDTLFTSISEQTTAWQVTSGRLLHTRSANLFLEGASRIQARAMALFGNNNNNTNNTPNGMGVIGSKFIKSFTEGDAALARLKSIELGDAIKDRLVKAIEVRSESLGGLDGIIVGALSTIQTKVNDNNVLATTTIHQINRIPELLKNLQQNASSITTNAHETLITILSSRSIYRDAALLRLEQTLCDLNDQIGHLNLSPKDIAAIVQGEGGTAKIFEPIASRAMKQIEQQLDSAELQVTDTTTLAVLSRIRKIMSGELSLSAIVDDIVNVLNDDKVVAVGERLVRQSEQVFDVIEGVSSSSNSNKAVADAIQIAEKAGITKESVMKELEKLKVDDLLGAAEKAVTDAKARKKLLSTATDVALDFVLRILPSMPVPPFEGVKDGLVYHISNLSMKGFKVKKEDIHIELAGMRATRNHKKVTQPVTPTFRTQHSAGTTTTSPTIAYPTIQKSYSADSEYSTEFDVDDVQRPIKATELLIIDIQNTSAVLENAIWNFEQTYLPYLKGGGIANVKMSGGAIRLQFELRKRRKVIDTQTTTDSSNTNPIWEPVLCLHDRSCTISEVDISLEGDGTITWLINKIATIFKSPLRDYVVSTIVKVLSNRSGWILDKLNKILAPYWDLILRTAKLDLDALIEADDDVIVSETVSTDTAFVELVWRERLPLGMNLLMNDDSGLLKVVDFPRGSQARTVCERRGFDPVAFEGATIVAVNGTQYDDQEELFESLRNPGRPKTIRFKLADTEDAERLRNFIEMHTKSHVIAPEQREFKLRTTRFLDDGDLGIEFQASVDKTGLIVRKFVEGDGGIVLAAERSGDIVPGDLLTHINDQKVIRQDEDGLPIAMKLLESSAGSRPLSLTFTEPYMHSVEIQKVKDAKGIDSGGGPSELIFGETLEGDKRRIQITGFTTVSGMAERCGVMIGDHLVFINGLPVGAGCRWLDTPSSPTLTEVMDMLGSESFYPIGLTFARRQQRQVSRWTFSVDEFSDSEAETICVTATSFDRLGILLDQMENGDVTVTDFQGVPGIFQRGLEKCKLKNRSICLTIESINGQYVPSYASIDLVRNALNRTWTTTEATLLTLCDDEKKKWLLSCE